MEVFDGRFKRVRFSPWRRGRPETFGNFKTAVNSFHTKFDHNIYRNMDLSIEVKRAALIASPSIVSVVSLTGDETVVFCGCGTIVDSEYIGGKYISTILTSASVMRSGDKLEEVNITKIHVHLADDTLFETKVFCYDLQYNIASLKIESAAALPKCTLKRLDDSISIDPTKDVTTAQLRPHSDLFRLSPGDLVVAVGRFWDGSQLMVAPGTFSLDICDDELDCKELFKADCQITKCGVGGPLINRYGEVIGINFYAPLYTPFLPINIVCKCLEHFKTYGKFPRPQLGMIFTNLYAASVEQLERIVREFPHVVKGVIVEKVAAMSNADRAGLVSGDVIIQCNETPVRGALEFLELILDKSGETVELTIVRSSSVQLKLSMVIDETSMHELNRWPLPQTCLVPVKRIRL